MSLQFKFSVHPCILIKLCCLKGGGGRGRPDFTIIFGGGGWGAGKKSLKAYEGTRRGGGGRGGGINSFFLSIAERKIEKLDQRKLEVIQPKIKNKSNLREGAFFGKSKKVGGR